ncbi:hypothetical protein [Candidatus Contendibacter odensensis]|nr:hypothetical protein [Candidatus Contendobacter odensis]
MRWDFAWGVAWMDAPNRARGRIFGSGGIAQSRDGMKWFLSRD